MIQIVMFTTVFALIFTLNYIALQHLDFSKFFRAGSTWQIKAVLVSVSAAVALAIASGIMEFIELFSIRA